MFKMPAALTRYIRRNCLCHSNVRLSAGKSESATFKGENMSVGRVKRTWPGDHERPRSSSPDCSPRSASGNLVASHGSLTLISN